MIPESAGTRSFTMLGARSASLVAGLSLAVVVESIAVHFFLHRRAPWLDWVVIASSVATLVWVVRDFRAMGAVPLVVTPAELRIALGRRFSATVPRSRITAVTLPTWRDLPAPTEPSYLKLSGANDPNVLVRFDAPVAFTGPYGISRRAALVGLFLDDAAGFASALAGPPRVES